MDEQGTGQGSDWPEAEAEAGDFLVVVLDVVTGAVDAYGPLTGARALRVADQLQGLLVDHGPTRVVVTLARFHDRRGAAHPDDP